MGGSTEAGDAGERYSSWIYRTQAVVVRCPERARLCGQRRSPPYVLRRGLHLREHILDARYRALRPRPRHAVRPHRLGADIFPVARLVHRLSLPGRGRVRGLCLFEARRQPAAPGCDLLDRARHPDGAGRIPAQPQRHARGHICDRPEAGHQRDLQRPRRDVRTKRPGPHPLGRGPGAPAPEPQHARDALRRHGRDDTVSVADRHASDEQGKFQQDGTPGDRGDALCLVPPRLHA